MMANSYIGCTRFHCGPSSGENRICKHVGFAVKCRGFNLLKVCRGRPALGELIECGVMDRESKIQRFGEPVKECKA